MYLKPLTLYLSIMKSALIPKNDLFNNLPTEWPQDLLPGIQRLIQEGRQKIVVLDDDPTGTQTVYDLPVLTQWSIDTLEAELQTRHPAFYILTNSRSIPSAEACQLNREIGANLKIASQRTGVRLKVISRSDSTLRGHFPDEVDALSEALGTGGCPYLLAPCFFEGHRYTVNDIHYVVEDGMMMPVTETAYARDAAFGYRHSDLRHWVEEKTRGRIPWHQVASLSIDDIRKGGPARVTEVFKGLPADSACVLNATTYRDLEVVVHGLLEAENQGCRLLCRTAASFVRVRCGLAPRPLLKAEDLVTYNACGGLFVVGSYVPKTTQQVNTFINRGTVAAIDVSVKHLLDPQRQAGEISRAIFAMNQALGKGKDTMVYTSRELFSGRNSDHSLKIGQQVSESLIRIVAGLKNQPRYLVAKGGVTSSDIATAGLGVRRAMILGQILPGVPVWALGDKTRFPGMAYIVFPGNVGDNGSLVAIQERLRA